MKCNGISKKTGEKCTANAMRGFKYCYLHNDNPEIAKKRAESSERGRNNQRPREEKIVIAFQSIKDIPNILQRLANDLYNHRISIQIASGIDKLLNTAIKSYSEGENREMLDQIKEQLIKAGYEFNG